MPDIVTKLRQEHDQVFGSNPNSAGELLRRDPALASKVPFTHAVIKESLRLFPPSGLFRQGRAGLELEDSQGRLYPTENTIICVLHSAIQTDPRVWVRPMEFLPERWMVSSEHELYPAHQSYRAFEKGPRRCMGQSLATTHLCDILVMIVRKFNFHLAGQATKSEAPSSRNIQDCEISCHGNRQQEYHVVSTSMKRAMDTE
jgi:cytochrome P450